MLITKEYGTSLYVYDERTYEQKVELKEFIDSERFQAILSGLEKSIVVL